MASSDETGAASVVRVTAQTQYVQRRQQLLTPDLIDSTSVDWHCYSAPQSRTGSFKTARRRSGLTDPAPRSSLPSLEDSITAKLLELQQLEADDCRVVREFITSKQGGIVHRGDSFRRIRDTSTDSSTTTKTRREAQRDRETDREEHSVVGRCEGQLSGDTVACKVVIVGDRGVGKTSLLQQLMTSHYMAAMNTCSFGQYTSSPSSSSSF